MLVSGSGSSRSALPFFSFFFTITIGALALALALLGLDMMTALTSATTAVCNVGPGLGPIIGPAGNFAPLSDPVKWTLTLAMLLGRLEFFTLLVLLRPSVRERFGAAPPFPMSGGGPAGRLEPS